MLRIGNKDAETGNALISITYQAAKIGQLDRINASYSNIIELPKTVVNDAIFDNALLASANTDKKYNTQKATLTQNGIDVLGNGQCLLTESTFESYEINLLSGNFDIINWLGEKTLKNVVFDRVPIVWNYASIVGSLGQDLETEKIVYAVYRTKDEINDLETIRMFPVVQVVEIIERMFDGSGIQLSGEFLSNPFIRSLAIPACYDSEQTGFKFAYFGEVEIRIATPPFSDVYYVGSQSESGKSSDSLTTQFSSIEANKLVITKYFQLAVLSVGVTSNEPTTPFNSFTISVLRGNTTIPLTFTSTVLSVNSERFVCDPFDYFPGDIITWDVDINQVAPDQRNTFFLQLIRKNNYTDAFIVSENLPNIKQIDLLKSLLLMFCGYPSANLDITYLNLFDTLKRASTYDITEKIQERSGIVTYRPDGYGVTNIFKYSGENESGNGQFTLNTSQTQAESEFEVLFEKQNTVQVGGKSASFIPVFDPSSGNVIEKIAPFIGFVEKDTPIALTIDALPFSPAPINYFRFEESLDFPDLLSSYWQTLISALEKAYYLEIQAYITSSDIAILRDFRKVVTIKKGKFAGTYFVINIEQFTGNDLCTLNLFRLQ